MEKVEIYSDKATLTIFSLLCAALIVMGIYFFVQGVNNPAINPLTNVIFFIVWFAIFDYALVYYVIRIFYKQPLLVVTTEYFEQKSFFLNNTDRIYWKDVSSIKPINYNFYNSGIAVNFGKDSVNSVVIKTISLMGYNKVNLSQLLNKYLDEYKQNGTKHSI
ncbi:MAG: hypothetical protein LBR70_00905 [Lactobacillaceae bacterium]|jgi:hypothetical protein|nr:hypothetical protein [Lactobacillaceae bacterium]